VRPPRCRPKEISRFGRCNRRDLQRNNLYPNGDFNVHQVRRASTRCFSFSLMGAAIPNAFRFNVVAVRTSGFPAWKFDASVGWPSGWSPIIGPRSHGPTHRWGFFIPPRIVRLLAPADSLLCAIEPPPRTKGGTKPRRLFAGALLQIDRGWTECLRFLRHNTGQSPDAKTFLFRDSYRFGFQMHRGFKSVGFD
jgi:hypothetical protein